MTTDPETASGRAEPVERALRAYTQERLNCAQSVLRGFQHDRALPEEQIVQAKPLGGGRAEQGRCGALHIALTLAQSDEVRQTLAAAFAEQAGSQQCREIRTAKRLACVQCVELAATLLVQHEGRLRQEGVVTQ